MIPWEVVEQHIRATHPYEVFALRAMLAVPYFEKVSVCICCVHAVCAVFMLCVLCIYCVYVVGVPSTPPTHPPVHPPPCTPTLYTHPPTHYSTSTPTHSLVTHTSLIQALYELPEAQVTPETILTLAATIENKIQGGPASRPLLSVPHILSDESACYYQGYVLAEMSVHQTRAYFKGKYGYITDNPAVGEELQKVCVCVGCGCVGVGF